jgi:hypothetical protein
MFIDEMGFLRFLFALNGLVGFLFAEMKRRAIEKIVQPAFNPVHQLTFGNNLL